MYYKYFFLISIFIPYAKNLQVLTEVRQLVEAQAGDGLMMVIEVVALGILEEISMIENLKEIVVLVDFLDQVQLKNTDLLQNSKSHQQVIYVKCNANYFYIKYVKSRIVYFVLFFKVMW